MSSRHGLFFWSPLLFLAILGLVRLRRDRVRPVHDRVLLCFGLGAFLLWYANSAWSCWWFGSAFGARAFLALTWLFVAGLAHYFWWLSAARLSHRRVGWCALVAGMVFHFFLLGLYLTAAIPRGGPLLAYW